MRFDTIEDAQAICGLTFGILTPDKVEQAYMWLQTPSAQLHLVSSSIKANEIIDKIKAP